MQLTQASMTRLDVRFNSSGEEGEAALRKAIVLVLSYIVVSRGVAPERGRRRGLERRRPASVACGGARLTCT